MSHTSSVSLAACGNEPEPIAPVEPSFDRTTESTDTDEETGVLPGTTYPDATTPDTTMPGAEAVPPVGSEPGELPEVMEDDPMMPADPAEPVEDPVVDPGAPQ